ncbi:MAG: polysaccharide deacetylase family protein [Candidatus Omnitrophica bacterium]|nr:polysaccharide deacetylase family protein [Candidatus Omnitrophota bacterium]
MLAVKPENFSKQIEHLKKNYNVLKGEDFFRILKNREQFPPKSILVTFDDGYADNFYQALPILESYNTQALFYISTSQLNTPREFWWDDLERIFLSNTPVPPKLKFQHNSDSHLFNTSTVEERTLTYRKVHPLIKIQDYQIRENTLQQLYSWAGVAAEGRKTHRILTENELLKLSQSSSALIGAHTHNHVPLSTLTYERQIEEMKTSKNILENITGRKISHFSYPFGTTVDYNRQSITAAKELHFSTACANFYWQVHSWNDPLQIPRILVRDWDLNEFQQKMKEFFKY